MDWIGIHGGSCFTPSPAALCPFLPQFQHVESFAEMCPRSTCSSSCTCHLCPFPHLFLLHLSAVKLPTSTGSSTTGDLLDLRAPWPWRASTWSRISAHTRMYVSKRLLCVTKCSKSYGTRVWMTAVLTWSSKVCAAPQTRRRSQRRTSSSHLSFHAQCRSGWCTCHRTNLHRWILTRR